MRLFLTFTPSVINRCDLTSGSRRELPSNARVARRTPTINHAGPPFIENKRYRPKPRRVGGMVNPKAVSVYQTDAVLILGDGVQGRSRKRALPREQFQQDETVQSTSMFKRMSLALLASASCLGAGLHQAQAVEAAAVGEPSVIYADQAAPPPAPVRLAYAERAMGGGFIEFLFGDGPN